MKLEKQTRHMMYDSVKDSYVVTYDPVGKDDRKSVESSKSIVSVAGAVTYWDSVDNHEHCLACAKAVHDAWKIGDRYLLDTNEARQAAEIVADLSVTKPDVQDICSALTDLNNAICSVRLMNLSYEDFDVLPVCREAFERCFAAEDYQIWNERSRRKRFLYELPRKYRTPVICTLMSLYFSYGSTPVITVKQRQELLALDRGKGLEGAVRYMDDCLRKITEYRF